MSRTKDASTYSEMNSVGRFDVGFAAFVASIISIFVVLVLFSYTEILFVLLLLAPLWVLTGWVANRHIAQHNKQPNAQTIMVCPGCTVEEKWKTLGYSMIVAAVPNYIASAVLTEIEAVRVPLTGWPITLSPLFHVFTALFLILAIFTILKARSYSHDLAEFKTAYASSTTYQTLEMAKDGRVVLGHEFRYAIQTSVPTAADSLHPLPGEIRTRTVRQWIGKDGPFTVDLEKERNPHCVVFGSSGTGKSETVRALVLRYWLAKQIPSLIIDWQGEYASFVRKIGGVVWSVPQEFTVNPLRLEGFRPSQRAAEIEESLIVNLELTALQASEVRKIVSEAYREAGIEEEDKETWKLPPPVWGDIIEIMSAKLRSGQYTGEKIQWIDWAILRLQRADRIFGEETQEFFGVALKVPTCIDLSGLSGADVAKALVTYTIFQRIYDQFDIRGFSVLKLLVVLEEAHQILQSQIGKTNSTQESLIVRIIRLGRKYGYGVILASHQPTDIPQAAISNAATIVAMMLDEPQQVNYVRRFVNLSKPEREIYATLPQGGAFIKHLGEPHSHLVKTQMVSVDEIQFSRSLTEKIRNEVLKPPTLQPLSMRSTDPPATETTQARSVRVSSSPSLNEVDEALTMLQKRIQHFLEGGPTTMKKLLKAFPNVAYRELLTYLSDLENHGFVQEEKVANLEGKGTVFYAALKSEWLQSESIEHRAMLLMISEALNHLRPVPYMRSEANAPDLGLELTNPKIAIEVETGRKKLTFAELDKWATDVKIRNIKLGYRDILVVVPNASVEAHYKEACEKTGLELTTMAKLGAKPCDSDKGDAESNAG